MFDNEDDYESNELDPVDKVKLQEQYEKELESSMRYAYTQIHEMGVNRWSANVGFSEDKKIRILENMITWYAAPEREEYEKAAELKRGLDAIRNS